MKQVLLYIASVLALIGIWWAASIILPFFFDGTQVKRVVPPPLDVLQLLVEDFPRLWNHLMASGLRVTWGLLIAMTIALPLGLVIGFQPFLNKFLSPLIYLSYPIPKVVFLPILFVLFNLQDSSRIALIALVLTFQILLSTRDAARNISPDHVLSALSAGANRWQLYWHVVLPGSLPAILTATRVSIGLAFAALYLAETLVAPSPPFGIGYYISTTFSVNGYSKMTAGIVAMGMLGFSFYIALDILERILCRWRFRR